MLKNHFMVYVIKHIELVIPTIELTVIITSNMNSIIQELMLLLFDILLKYAEIC